MTEQAAAEPWSKCGGTKSCSLVSDYLTMEPKPSQSLYTLNFPPETGLQLFWSPSLIYCDIWMPARLLTACLNITRLTTAPLRLDLCSNHASSPAGIVFVHTTSKRERNKVQLISNGKWGNMRRRPIICLSFKSLIRLLRRHRQWKLATVLQEPASWWCS